MARPHLFFRKISHGVDDEKFPFFNPSFKKYTRKIIIVSEIFKVKVSTITNGATIFDLCAEN